MASEVTVLPEPDSPTKATVSPRATEKLTSVTTATGPNSTLSCWTSKRLTDHNTGRGQTSPPERPTVSLRLDEVAALVGGELHGPPELELGGVTSWQQAGPQDLTFLESSRLTAAVNASLAGAVLASSSEGLSKPVVLVKKPRVAFALILNRFHPRLRKPAGIHPTAQVDPKAVIDPSASVGPFCQVAKGVVLEGGVELEALVSIGPGSRIGQGSFVRAQVHLGPEVRVGQHCLLESRCSLGQGTRLDDRVDIGANSQIGPACHVGQGSKIDNLVSLGRGVHLGRGCLLVSKTLAEQGSHLGDYVVLGGQASVGRQTQLTSMVQLGGRSRANHPIEAPGQYLGDPPVPLKQAMRSQAARDRILLRLGREKLADQGDQTPQHEPA